MGPYVGPGPNSVGARTLRLAGEALFGTQWQTELAEALSRYREKPVNSSLVRRWNAGGRSIPVWVFAAIVAIAQERKSGIDVAVEEILRLDLTNEPAPEHMY